MSKLLKQVQVTTERENVGVGGLSGKGVSKHLHGEMVGSYFSTPSNMETIPEFMHEVLFYAHPRGRRSDVP